MRARMLFNSIPFALFALGFFPVYALLARWREARRLWLLTASLFFYGWWDVRFLALLVATSTLDWALARWIDGLPAGDPRRRRIAIGSVVSNLGVLAIFKYLGFFARELERALATIGLDTSLPALQLVLPVGLSFYTFQAMSYVLDVAKGEVRAERRLPHFLLYITFFPQLVAGPIERSARLMPQLEALRLPRPEQVTAGLLRFLGGLVRKLVIADNAAMIVDRAYGAGATPTGMGAAIGIVAFTVQIYGDFSGYSEMARGLASMLGIELMENFRRPLLATGPRDLWRRWHISLSTWLRDYLYVPLGGDRGGPWRTARNLAITMLLGGLWHGASWTFVVWGALHGLALAVERAWRANVSVRMPAPLAVLGCLSLTIVGFAVFRADSLGQALALMGTVLRKGLYGTPSDFESMRILAVVGGGLFVWDLIVEKGGLSLDRIPRPLAVAASAALTALIAILGATYGRPFVYFQF